MLSLPARSTVNKSVALLASGSAILSLLGAAGQSASPASKRPRDVEFLGICSFDNSKLTCWSTDGRKNATVERQVDRVLRGRSSPSLQYRYGMKNRLLVFGQNERAQITFSRSGNSYSSPIEGVSDGLGPSLRILPIATDPDRKVGSISGVIQTGEPGGTAVGPLKEGTELMFGSAKLRIGVAEIQTSQEQNPTDPNAAPVTRKSYTYPLTVTASEGTSLDLRATAIDLEGKVIVNVDASGRPIPAAPQSPTRFQGYYNPLSVGWTGGDRTNSILITTIDPAFIREVRWASTLNRRFEFNDFALDLKR